SRLVTTRGDLLHHIEHVPDRAEAVAELLDGDGGGDEAEALRAHLAEIQIGDVWHVQREAEDEQRAAEPEACGEEAARQRAEDEPGGAVGAVDRPEAPVRQAESAHGPRVEQKERPDLLDEALAEAVEVRERDHRPDAALLEEARERCSEGP